MILVGNMRLSSNLKTSDENIPLFPVLHDGLRLFFFCIFPVGLFTTMTCFEAHVTNERVFITCNTQQIPSEARRNSTVNK